MSLEEYYFHLSGFISSLIMASAKYKIYFVNIISAETSLPLDAEEFACLDKQNNKIKCSCPRSLLILLTQTMTCRLNRLMSLRLIGILWAFKLSYPTLPFFFNQHVQSIHWCFNMWIFKIQLDVGNYLRCLIRAALDRCACICLHVFVQTGEGKALPS